MFGDGSRVINKENDICILQAVFGNQVIKPLQSLGFYGREERDQNGQYQCHLASITPFEARS